MHWGPQTWGIIPCWPTAETNHAAGESQGRQETGRWNRQTSIQKAPCKWHHLCAPCDVHPREELLPSTWSIPVLLWQAICVPNWTSSTTTSYGISVLHHLPYSQHLLWEWLSGSVPNLFHTLERWKHRWLWSFLTSSFLTHLYLSLLYFGCAFLCIKKTTLS